jgi:hypothetical protein
VQTATELTINQQHLLDLLDEIARYDHVQGDNALMRKVNDARQYAAEIGAAIEPLLEDNKDLAYRFYQIEQRYYEAPSDVSHDVKRYRKILLAGGSRQLVARVVKSDYPDDPIRRLKVLRTLFELDLQAAQNLDSEATNTTA